MSQQPHWQQHEPPAVPPQFQQPHPYHGQPYYPAPGWQQYPPQQFAPPPRRGFVRRHPILTSFAAIVLLLFGIGVGTSLHGPKAQGTGASSFGSSTHAGPATSAAAAVKQSVTFVVTGSPADVTYGPAGTSVSGTVPMRITKPLGNPMYYSLQAQLQGSGQVTCKILVDGKIISQSVASGSYNIADCEISQDMLSGEWTDTNAG